MSATIFVFVKHDGAVAVVPASEFVHAPEWMIRNGEAFIRSHYACRFCSDDEQEGAMVYVQRPVRLYDEERDQRERAAAYAARQLAEMPPSTVFAPPEASPERRAIVKAIEIVGNWQKRRHPEHRNALSDHENMIAAAILEASSCSMFRARDLARCRLPADHAPPCDFERGGRR